MMQNVSLCYIYKFPNPELDQLHLGCRCLGFVFSKSHRLKRDLVFILGRGNLDFVAMVSNSKQLLKDVCNKITRAVVQYLNNI